MKPKESKVNKKTRSHLFNVISKCSPKSPLARKSPHNSSGKRHPTQKRESSLTALASMTIQIDEKLKKIYRHLKSSSKTPKSRQNSKEKTNLTDLKPKTTKHANNSPKNARNRDYQPNRLIKKSEPKPKKIELDFTGLKGTEEQIINISQRPSPEKPVQSREITPRKDSSGKLHNCGVLKPPLYTNQRLFHKITRRNPSDYSMLSKCKELNESKTKNEENSRLTRLRYQSFDSKGKRNFSRTQSFFMEGDSGLFKPSEPVVVKPSEIIKMFP